MPDESTPYLPARVDEQPRGGNGRWRRAKATVERDAEVLERVSNGETFRHIARDMGYSSVASVHEAFGRARKDIVTDRAGEAREKALLRIETWRKHAVGVLKAQHPMVSQGSVVWMTQQVIDPETGEAVAVRVPVLDATQNLGAIDRLVKLEQEEARLRGTYAPTASKVTKLTDEDLDDLIAREHAAADQAEADTDEWEPGGETVAPDPDS